MTYVEPGQRRKAKTPRSRSGCGTCRARHVKCGEERPACIRCISIGRKCDGYGRQMVPSRDSSGPTVHVRRMTPAASPFSGKELRSLRFFLEWTVSQIRGFHPSSFWSELVPQVAHTEPSIRHALVALSNFHELFVLQSDSSEQPRFALRQYNLAIRELLDSRAPQTSPLVSLLCCVLFICIELLQFKHLSAIQLLKNGKNLLFEMQNARTTISTRYICARVRALFVCLDFQASTVQPIVNADPPRHTYSSFPPSCPPPVTELSSMFEAHLHYEEIAHSWVQHAWAGQRNVALFSERLDQWHDAFQTLLKTQTFAIHDRRAAALLEVNRLQLDLSLASGAFPPGTPLNPLWWDDKLPLFEEMVNHAAAAVELLDEHNFGRPSFSLDSGINVHLYTVAVRCRDPVLRRRAIAILRAANRHEGLLRADFAAKVAERIVELEEGGLENIESSKDVPREARLQNVVINLNPATRNARIRYVVKGKIVEEIIAP